MDMIAKVLRLKKILAGKTSILLLVHPDCVPAEPNMIGEQQAEEYLSKLETYLPQFDKLVVFRMHGPIRSKWIEEGTENQRALFKRLNVLLSKADLDLFDKDLGLTLFKDELSSFIIDHPDGTLYLAGGYQANCLRHVASNLVSKLGWLFKEQNYKVRVFEPLVFRQRSDDKTQPDHPWWSPKWPNSKWAHEEDEESKAEDRVPSYYRYTGGLMPKSGEYARGETWEGPVDTIASVSRLRRILVAHFKPGDRVRRISSGEEGIVERVMTDKNGNLQVDSLLDAVYDIVLVDKDNKPRMRALEPEANLMYASIVMEEKRLPEFFKSNYDLGENPTYQTALQKLKRVIATTPPIFKLGDCVVYNGQPAVILVGKGTRVPRDLETRERVYYIWVNDPSYPGGRGYEIEAWENSLKLLPSAISIPVSIQERIKKLNSPKPEPDISPYLAP